MYPWCSNYFININACGVLGARFGVQVFRREIHTYIHLDYVRVEILSYIKKKKKKVGGKVNYFMWVGLGIGK